MKLLGDLLGLLAFRSRAVRSLAARGSLVAAYSWLIIGYLSFVLARSLAYDSESPDSRISRLLDLNLIQVLVFLALVYVPAIASLSNAFAGDGFGFTFSREEYRAHVSVLFPLWGTLYLLATPVLWIGPRFLSVGMLEVGPSILGLGLGLAVYSVWAIHELNYLPLASAAGVFMVSWLTLPIFWVLMRFLLSLPLLLLFPLGYLLFRRVQGFFEAGARERELRQHLSALTANPRDAEAHHQLGLLHLARGDVEEARKHFQEAFRIDPSDPDYTYDMGRSYELKGEWPSACDFYEDTYRLDPVYRMRDVMREVGKSYLHTGELDKAVEFLQFFLESRGSDPEGRYWLAVALQERGNREEARLQLQTLLEQARSNPRFFRKGNRAWLYRARRLLRQAA